ncbi:DUF4129 domain-containing protein [Hoyosella rhizosphaerae]|uniref:Protein-glutamine gamma-glutamyltransferase-like C-terminal domain-containing protein n=1 Tax=Hoyosella rhizosphaerae TaxID=1755582 RepID=A0A916XHH1_9ACTN|nr:DUF4129 domain-containing protein [Hoyosella rhizosphaerae]MBN4928262.1 DUF4129 domain-containing protein [Hoyosella rhizosphaerae]GGC73642.1 hypothetical protein GCM10011410_28490 [Hoyosella rhizosphaerae]
MAHVATVGALTWALVYALRHEPLTGEPLLPDSWTVALLVIVMGGAIAITGLAVFFLWRHPRTRVIRTSGPTMMRFVGAQRRSGKRWRLIAWIAVAAVLIAAILLILQQRDDTIVRVPPPSTENGHTTAEPITEQPVTVTDPDEEANFGPFFLIALVLLVGLLVLGTFLAMRNPRRVLGGESWMEPSTTIPAQRTSTEVSPLEMAAQRGLAAITDDHTNPRDAIIACYAEMEQALTEAEGASPLDSDTPSEVLGRAVSHGYVHKNSADALVQLFAEARFSKHTMTHDQQRSAADLLRNMLADVRRTPSVASR